MNIIGISAHYHEAACCLLRDGELVAAAMEERFSRVKHDPRLPVSAFRHCLDEAELRLSQIDHVAYYEDPIEKLGRQLWMGAAAGPRGRHWLDAERPVREIRELLGYEGPIRCFEHHASHAASAYYYSGFPRAAVLVVDGVGEWATTSYWRGEGAAVEKFDEVRFPHSLGLFYATLTSYLGFDVNSDEYKVMGLAPYGRPSFAEALRSLVRPGAGGQFELDLEYFDFGSRQRSFTPRLVELLGQPPREPESRIDDFHCDVARSLQCVLEDVLLEKARYLAAYTGMDRLCLAGGVALNCVAVGALSRAGMFRDVFVQPAAGDAGGALGAAALLHVELESTAADRQRTPIAPLRHTAYGPAFDGERIARDLGVLGIAFLDFRGREDELLEETVDRLVQGDVVAWFHGAMELGPRALGSRSILADPRDPEMRERLNARVKKREAFRPFAPVVRWERASEHFELAHASPFMTEACQVRSSLELPAITHVDGSARPQTVDRAVMPRFAALLDAFERRSGCPVLVNTSFNVRGEPIVCTPRDALLSFARSGIDALVLEDCLLDRASLTPALERLLAATARAESSGIQHEVYTFV